MKTEKVKICCHSCSGDGWVTEETYPLRKKIKVACPECEGAKFVYANVLAT